MANNKIKKLGSSKPKKSKSNKLILIVYDLLIVVAISVIGLLAYPSNISFIDGMIHTAIWFVVFTLVRYIFSIYHQVWRYGGIQAYIRLLISDAIATVLCILIELVFLLDIVPLVTFLHPLFVVAVCSVICLFALFMRMAYRYGYKCLTRDTKWARLFGWLVKVFSGTKLDQDDHNSLKKINVAIVGAGKTGTNLANDFLNNVASAYRPVLFIDNSKEKIGRTIFDIPVISEHHIDKGTFEEYHVKEIIFALPTLSQTEKSLIYQKYAPFGLKIRIYDIPTLTTANETQLKQVRDFDIEELLFREQKDIITPDIAKYYKDKTVLITGGGGSIGSEMARQIAKMSPKQIILLDVYENCAYDVQQELKGKYAKTLNLQVEICSITNRPALERIFKEYKIDIVIHAAAHKHVPFMEHNPTEAVQNNIFGTLNVVELTEKYKVGRFMMVSTDKAVNPTNVMGATKRMCEMIVFAHAKESKTTIYSATRFGNVLGSAGSVIPLFKKQIANGGPLTLTDRRIVRFFMTIPEASQLVLTSGYMAKNGQLFVLDMGQPIKILSLAEAMIKLSGFVPYKDILIVETGLRPGEKLYEEVLNKTEGLQETDNKLIFIAKDEPITVKELNNKLKILEDAVNTVSSSSSSSALSIKDALRKVVDTYHEPEDNEERMERAK